MPAPEPAAGVWWRQLLGVMRLEFHHYFRGRRAWGVWLLAVAPVLLLAAKAGVQMLWGDEIGLSLAREEEVFAELYEALILRLCLFFGCVIVFINLFRGDVMDRTLHYYFLTPVRRDVIAAGKFCAGVLFTSLLFGGATLAARLLMYSPYGRAAAMEHLLAGPGLGLSLAYLGLTVLACVGYGSVFLLAGILARNPIIPAFVILFWESLNIFLPPPLRQMSVIYYLASLIPIPRSMGFVGIPVEPAPPALAVPGLLVLAAVLLLASGRRAAAMEVDYSGD
jgi:ABC-type transport system involved in multi-copper enzyme maturation permease subunit